MSSCRINFVIHVEVSGFIVLKNTIVYPNIKINITSKIIICLLTVTSELRSQ